MIRSTVCLFFLLIGMSFLIHLLWIFTVTRGLPVDRPVEQTQSWAMCGDM